MALPLLCTKTIEANDEIELSQQKINQILKQVPFLEEIDIDKLECCYMSITKIPNKKLDLVCSWNNRELYKEYTEVNIRLCDNGLFKYIKGQYIGNFGKFKFLSNTNYNLNINFSRNDLSTIGYYLSLLKSFKEIV